MSVRWCAHRAWARWLTRQALPDRGDRDGGHRAGTLHQHRVQQSAQVEGDGAQQQKPRSERRASKVADRDEELPVGHGQGEDEKSSERVGVEHELVNRHAMIPEQRVGEVVLHSLREQARERQHNTERVKVWLERALAEPEERRGHGHQ
eukprot:5307558-Prymnesium_polylepis.1